MNPHEQPKIESEHKPEEKEAFTSIVRVLGRKYEDISEEERQKVFKYMEKIFKDQDKLKKDLLRDFGSRENIPDEFIKTIFFERPKSPEELEIIGLANEETNKLRKKFGLSELNISPKNIYLVPYNAPWPKNYEKSDSYYVAPGQFSVVREPSVEQLRDSRLILAENVLHEMLHFKLYNSLKKLENYPMYKPYRVGLEIYERDDSSRSYFGNLDEAITEELTIRLLSKVVKHPLFKKDLEQTKKAKELFVNKKTENGESLVRGSEFYIYFDEENSMLQAAHYTKERERKSLNKLIEKIYQKNIDKFKSKDEVFYLFVQAVVTGRIIGLGRVIDNTFGKGTFRKIAEADQDINQLEELIESLK